MNLNLNKYQKLNKSITGTYFLQLCNAVTIPKGQEANEGPEVRSQQPKVAKSKFQLYIYTTSDNCVVH